MSQEKLNRFLDQLDRDSSSRKLELHHHKNLLAFADEYQKPVLCRCGVLLLYSHWEGFIKYSIKRYLGLFSGSKIKSIPVHIKIAALFDFLKSEQQETLTFRLAKIANEFFLRDDLIVKRNIDEVVRTGSNLDFKHLENLWCLIDVDDSRLKDNFATRENFINFELVGTRNSIAHGEKIPISVETYELLYAKTLELMESFKSIIIQSATQYHDHDAAGTQ